MDRESLIEPKKASGIVILCSKKEMEIGEVIELLEICGESVDYITLEVQKMPSTKQSILMLTHLIQLFRG